MPRNWFRDSVLGVAAICLSALGARGDEIGTGLKKGSPDLKSAGPLAFAPDGTLFVGDTTGAALFALDTGDHTAAAKKRPVAVEDLAGKVATLLGTDPKRIMINDLAVNPRSGNVYLSVSRGIGPDAAPGAS